MIRKYFNFVLFSTFISIFFVFFSSCDDGPTEPSVEPGSRNYTWEVDTIYSTFNNLTGLWGYESNNVWAVGPGGSSDERVWHFDGKGWNKSLEGIGATPNTIFGFTPSNIWIGGGDGIILKYNGSNWIQQAKYQPSYPNPNSVSIADIWGTNTSEMYAVGVNFYKGAPEEERGFILSFDGKEWKEIYHASYNSQFLEIRKDKGKIIVFGIKAGFGEADTLAFWKYESGELKEIYSNSNDNIIWGSLSQLGDNYYYVIGKEVFTYQNGRFVHYLDFNFENFGYSIYGRNEKDLFIYFTDGLAHYNGTDIEYMYKFTHPIFTYIDSNTFITEEECFFLLRESYTGLFLILHGKLLE